MAFEFVELDVAQPTASRVLQWQSDAIVCRNHTPYPLYVNWRTSMIPNSISYDELIPSGSREVFGAVGNNFGFFLDTQNALVPTIGQKCLVTIQADEVIPSFSIANFNSTYRNNFNLVNAATQTYDINTAGSASLNVSIALSTGGTGGIYVQVLTSDDNGATYNLYRTYGVFVNNPLLKSFPGNGRLYRFILANQVTTETNAGTFAYTLSGIFAPFVAEYAFVNLSANSASIAGGGTTVNGTTRFGTMRINELHLHFNTTANDTDFHVIVRARPDSASLDYYISRSGALGNVNFLGYGTPYLIHRRINAYVWKIPVDLPCKDSFRLDVVNGGALAITNAYWEWRGAREI